jgi:hypothetical protein
MGCRATRSCAASRAGSSGCGRARAMCCEVRGGEWSAAAEASMCGTDRGTRRGGAILAQRAAECGLRQGGKDEGGDPSRGEPSVCQSPRDGFGRPHIRCPRCEWRHDWRRHWGCECCGVHFDTFVTRANCPDSGCGKSWTFTWCPGCGECSPHEDWYAAIGPRSN